MRSVLVSSVLLAALAPLAAPPAHAAAAVPPGHVYFWAEPGQMGAGGAWDYLPPGYKEAEPRVKRHAYSFDSRASGTVYAIGFQSGGACLYRAIHPDDYSDNWSWATKFDGVSDTTMGCEAG
ncbi:hypothetical protein [Streptomyces sp. NPDC057253]|uniref:hypothetical protein n=1 Tax=Streptomyces sp. NPDC057253 TaxID=3346069 RepID=UPI00362B14B5